MYRQLIRSVVAETHGVLVQTCLDRRQALRSNARIQQAIHTLWDFVPKDSEYFITKSAYIELMARIVLALVHEISCEKAMEVAQRDWEYDAEGRNEMTLERFFDSIFELADLYCPFIDPEKYALFLYEIASAIGEPSKATLKPSHESLESFRSYITVSASENITPMSLRDCKSDILKFHNPSQMNSIPSTSETWLSVLNASRAETNVFSLKQLIVKHHKTIHSTSEKAALAGLDSLQKRGWAKDSDGQNSSSVAHGNGKYSTKHINALLHRYQDDDWNDVQPTFQGFTRRGGIRLLVTGPPLCGKTTLAKRLAAEMNMVYISGSSCLEEAVHLVVNAEVLDGEENTESSQEDITKKTSTIESLKSMQTQIGRRLLAGQSISKEDVMKLLLWKVVILYSHGGAFVLDDVDSSELEHARMRHLLPEHVPVPVLELDCVLVLDASPEDSLERIHSLQYEPASGTSYSSRDVAQLTAQPEMLGFATDVPLPFEESTNESLDGAKEEKEGEKDNEEDEAQETSGEDGEDNEKAKLWIPEVKEYPVLEPKEPLIQNDAHAIQRLMRQSAAYYARKTASFSIATTVLTLSSNQAPRNVLKEAMMKVFGGFPPIVAIPYASHPLAIPLPADVAEREEGKQIQWLLYGDIQSELPTPEEEEKQKWIVPEEEARSWSPWKKMCPVAHFHGEVGVLGQAKYAALVSGKIFLTASEENQQAFVADPWKFLTKPPPATLLNTKTIWVFGNPLPCGEAEVSRVALLLAEKNNLLPVNVATIIENELKSREDLKSKVKDGGVIDYGTVGLLLAKGLKTLRDKGTESWLLHGFIPLKEVVQQLASSGVLPREVVALEADADTFSTKELALLAGMKLPIETHHKTYQSIISELETELSAHQAVLHRVELYSEVEDTVAQVHQRLCPLECRVDGEAQGYVEGSETGSVAEQVQRSLYGSFGLYCPVSLKLLKRLIPGKEEFHAYVNGRKYLFVDETEKTRFCRNPTKYLLPSTELALPPPLVLFLGPTSSGKHTQSMQFQEHLKGLALDYTRLTRAFETSCFIEQGNINAEEGGEGEEKDIGEEKKEELYFSSFQSILASMEQQQVSDATCYTIAGLGVESRVTNSAMVQKLIDHRLHPTIVFNLDITEETFIERHMSSWKFDPPSPETEEDGEVSEPLSREQINALANEARESYVEALKSQYASEKEIIAESLQLLQEAGIPNIETLNANGTSHRVFKRLKTAWLTKYSDRKSSMLGNVGQVALSVERCLALLKSGYARVGKFRLCCPVTYHERKTFISNVNFPVLHHDCIYFLASLTAQTKFVSNPTKYVRRQQVAPSNPFPVGISIVGPACSGKSKLSQYLSEKLGMVHVTLAKAMEYVQTCGGGSRVWHQLQKGTMYLGVMTQQQQVDHEVHFPALKMYLDSMLCQTKGWILDGILNSPDRIDLAFLYGIRPHATLMIDCNLADVCQRLTTHAQESTSASSSLATWTATKKYLEHFYVSTYGCGGFMKRINGKQSTWKMVDEGLRHIKRVQESMQYYAQAATSHRTASIARVAISLEDIKSAVDPKFELFCPVSLYNQKYYQSNYNDRSLTVLYNGRFYWCRSSSEMEAFSFNPEKYLNACKYSITSAPVAIGLGSILTAGNDFKLAFKGYCPVTYYEGKGPQDWSSILKGSDFFLAAYEQQIFALLSEEKRQKFLQEPTRYAVQTLPIKLPPSATVTSSLNLCGLPGELEQLLSRIINESLVELGAKRLKYPGLDIKTSALYYLAFILKAKNTKKAPHIAQRQKQILACYQQDCHLYEYIKNLALVGLPGQSLRTQRDKAALQERKENIEKFDDIVKNTGSKSYVQEKYINL